MSDNTPQWQGQTPQPQPGWQPQPRPADQPTPPPHRRRNPFLFGCLGVVAGVIIVAVIAALASSSGGSGTSSTSSTSADKPVSNSGNTEHPPARDVKVAKCEVDNSYDLNLATAKLTVTNHSSKTSDYVITVEFVAGGTRVGESGTFVNALRPGQTSKTDVVGDSGGEARVACKVTQVERTAS